MEVFPMQIKFFYRMALKFDVSYIQMYSKTKTFQIASNIINKNINLTMICF